MAKWGAKSSTLPPQTLIAQPKTEEEIHESYVNYVHQMVQSPMNWKLAAYAKGKTYEREGQAYHCLIREDKENFSLDFLPAGPLPEEHTRKTAPKAPPKKRPESPGRKPWWKFW